MKTFVDNKGENWTLKLTLGQVRQISHKIGIDLLDPQHYFKVLHSLTERLTFVFCLCEDKAKGMGIDADEFEERLYGDGVATEASEAFLSECEVFFLKLGQKGAAELVNVHVKTMRAGQTRLDEMISSGQIASLSLQVEKELAALSPSTAGDGSPN